MGRRWQWAPGLTLQWRHHLADAFDVAAIQPVALPHHRHTPGRAYGLLPTGPALPFDVFVKQFLYNSRLGQLRDLCHRSGACREFGAAVRLHGLGLPVPRPLALVSEPARERGRRCLFLMEHLGPGATLSEALATADGPDRAQTLITAAARLLVDLAEKGVWFRDTNTANFHVVPEADGRPLKIHLLDMRHTRFGVEPATALDGMLGSAAAFLYRDGASPAAIEALVEAGAAHAKARGASWGTFRTDDLLEQAKESAALLLAREIRKGHRPPNDLDHFAERYGGPRDAVNYRDRRFGRSRHGRKVDAAERHLVDDLLGRLGIRGPVLDVPCGTGRFVPVFAARGCEVLAGDVSAEMLALARRTAAMTGAPCRCLTLDARRLPLPDNAVDLAFAMRLLHRVRDPAERSAVLAELGRVSRRWVLFSFYNRRSARGLRDRLRGRYPGETRAAIRRDAAAAGLRVQQFLPVGPLARQTLVLCEVTRESGTP